MRVGLRVQLSLMFFLQYAIVGAWGPVLWPYLVGPAPVGLGLTAMQASLVYGMTSLAALFAPFVGGQIADRWVPTQWILVAVNLVCGVVLLAASQQRTYAGLAVLWGVYSLLAGSAGVLGSSLAFHHLRDAEREFGGVRVAGSLGFIASGWGLSLWRSLVQRSGAAPVGGDCLVLAGGCALAMGVVCLFLPHTPPSRDAGGRPAFFKALGLFRSGRFVVFMALCVLTAVGIQFYYMASSAFLEEAVGIARAHVPAVMTVGQVAELFTTACLLGVVLGRLGYRRALALGAAAWAVRYLVFSLHEWLPWRIVVGSIALHGIAFPFYYVVAQLFVNRLAPADIRASAQALPTMATFGLGTFLGAQLGGFVIDAFTTSSVAGGIVRDWTMIFLVPCLITGACAVAFWLLVREPADRAAAEAMANDE